MADQPQHRHQPFPTTSWSLVLRAGQDDTHARQALGVLLERYLPALRAHLVLYRRVPADTADDLLQGFVSQKILEQKLIARSDRARGRFRALLLSALNYYMIDETRRRRARGGEHVQLGEAGEWDQFADEQPSDVFNAAWARQVVAEAVRRMRQECAALRRADLWTLFEHRVLRPTLYGVDPTPYEQLVPQLRLESAAQASNVLVTAKRMFARMVRGVLSESAENEEEVEEDLRDLGRYLGTSQD
jgi:DNA-directed RNA polymerase specialized sigma24 family protein